MHELTQEILIYSIVIGCVLALSVWWEQTWDPDYKYKWNSRAIIVNSGLVLIFVSGLMIGKALTT